MVFLQNINKLTFHERPWREKSSLTNFHGRFNFKFFTSTPTRLFKNFFVLQVGVPNWSQGEQRESDG